MECAVCFLWDPASSSAARTLGLLSHRGLKPGWVGEMVSFLIPALLSSSALPPPLPTLPAALTCSSAPARCLGTSRGGASQISNPLPGPCPPIMRPGSGAPRSWVSQASHRGPGSL